MEISQVLHLLSGFSALQKGKHFCREMEGSLLCMFKMDPLLCLPIWVQEGLDANQKRVLGFNARGYINKNISQESGRPKLTACRLLWLLRSELIYSRKMHSHEVRLIAANGWKLMHPESRNTTVNWCSKYVWLKWRVAWARRPAASDC